VTVLAPGEKLVVAHSGLKGRNLRAFLRASRKVISAPSEQERGRLLASLPRAWGVRQHLAFFVFTNMRALGPSLLWWAILGIICYAIALVGPFILK
jgi:hypothetical protein